MMRGRSSRPPFAIAAYARAIASGVVEMLWPNEIVASDEPLHSDGASTMPGILARQLDLRRIAEPELADRAVHPRAAGREADFGGADVVRVRDDLFERLAAAHARRHHAVLGVVDRAPADFERVARRKARRRRELAALERRRRGDQLERRAGLVRVGRSRGRATRPAGTRRSARARSPARWRPRAARRSTGPSRSPCRCARATSSPPRAAAVRSRTAGTDRAS